MTWPDTWAAVVGATAGLLYVLVGHYENRRRKASLGWRATTGTIIEIEIQSDHLGWFPRVYYTYEVGEGGYSATRFDLMRTRYATRDAAQRAMDALGIRENASTTVFHDPAKPRAAVLVRGGRPWTWRQTWCGAILVGLLAMGAVLYSR